MLILAIETSCDETSASVVKDGIEVLSNVVSTSSNLFEETGGVVPEVAARKQVEYIVPVIQKALAKASLDIEQIDSLAVTVGPGLVGSLLVGVTAVKTLSFIYNKPVIPVNHLLGHVYSVFITEYLGKTVQPKKPDFPNLVLVASGGHTDLILLNDRTQVEYLGGTRDDACGEAFDKVARVVGLSNYLGGPILSKTALGSVKKYDFSFPRPMLNSGTYDFSFSGLKTAVINYLQFDLQGRKLNKGEVANVCKEFEDSVTEVLLTKTLKAFNEFNPKSISVVGGVSANSKLRNVFTKEFGDKLFLPPLSLCGDNAAMIGCAAYYLQDLSTRDLSTLDANPGLSLEILG
ncbi:tRNA (adenosine(37)-N6)-threonylcarbamoyltransferase complex transferase subunit TsaD [bacterium]|nr:tRNA (adenosine(37)-N6)-threonylcarbamoyltransferase complex transferase subunit TsaD [bacterium]